MDDATREILPIYFFEVDSTQAYFEASKRYFKKQDQPKAMVTDRHSIFGVNAKTTKEGPQKTQFSRSMNTLGISLILAKIPQDIGQVERAHQAWLCESGLQSP